MKKLLTLILFFATGTAQAAYLFRNSASNINSGILDPTRVLPTTFTMRGTDWANGVDSATGTLGGNLNAYTSSADARFGFISSTFNTYASSADAHFGFVTSTFTTYVSTADQRMNNLAVPLSIYGAGSYLTNATAVNCTTNLTCTNAGSTITISAAGGAQTRYYDVTIATFGSLAGAVDIASNNVLDALTTAYWRINALGLLQATTIQARIQFMPGNYFIPTVSTFPVPTGVTINGIENSTAVVFVTTNTCGSLINIYGIVNGINFDFQNRSITGTLITLSSGGVLSNGRTFNGGNVTPSVSASIGQVGATGITTATIRNFTLDKAAEVGSYGGGLSGGFAFKSSTGLTFDNVSVSSSCKPYVNSEDGAAGFNLTNCDNTLIKNSYFPSVTQNFLLINDSRNTRIMNNTFVVISTGGDTAGSSTAGSAIGIVTYFDGNMYVGSSTWIVGNTFFNANQNVSKMINLRVATHLIYNTIIENNLLSALPFAGTNSVLVSIAGASQFLTVLNGNHTVGQSLITDSGGIATKVSSQNNFKNGVQQ